MTDQLNHNRTKQPIAQKQTRSRVGRGLLLTSILLLVGICLFYVWNIVVLTKTIGQPPAANVVNTSPPIFTATSFPALPVNESAKYEVYVRETLVATFSNYDDALSFARQKPKAIIQERGKLTSLWGNYDLFSVFAGNRETFQEATSFAQALDMANTQKPSYIYHNRNKVLVWSNAEPLPESAQTDAPVIRQQPELPRGCEVTSLCMLLQYHGVTVDKMTLAGEIPTFPFRYTAADGKVHHGNPHKGFVGDMRSYNRDGLGVYHEPICELLARYLPDSAMDLSLTNFEDLLYLVQAKSPVWVVTNATFAPLPPSAFTTWTTDNGEIQVTYKEHAVLVTGYDKDYIYFNDPLQGAAKAPRADFIAAWNQMGRQAVGVSP